MEQGPVVLPDFAHVSILRRGSQASHWLIRQTGLIFIPRPHILYINRQLFIIAGPMHLIV